MSGDFIQRGGLWVLGQFALLFTVAVLGVTRGGEPRPLAGMLGGVVLLTAAAVCGLGGVRALGRSLTPFPRPSARTQLVQQGIYGWMRHPLYTAVICAALGWSLIWSSWTAFLASLVLALFLDAKARHEEQWLRRQFPEYAGYEQRVRRFVPWVY